MTDLAPVPAFDSVGHPMFDCPYCGRGGWGVYAFHGDHRYIQTHPCRKNGGRVLAQCGECDRWAWGADSDAATAAVGQVVGA